MGGDDFHKGVKEPNAKLDGSSLRILIVHTRWNSQIVDPLVEGAMTTLQQKYNVKLENIHVRDVPGAFELPSAAQRLLNNSSITFDAAICIGVLIKGSTMHFEYIADAVSHGIMRVGLDTGIPVVFGVLTCLTDEQALQRAGVGSGSHNHGTDWGSAAVEMALLKL
ncbi:lumazine synthase [Coemansia thaxteri]|uniref:6,7-dimethyl-8-ribityllumazine synthase n=1 Tax=Coemansia thaxteri TaxID=2663907 RepID=A0A9W8EII6_9FUNG|nr:lumazine synthase [Coemansia thaxteri]KAJ2004467.1 lumazine synthase [Coemansia thaxteri]KAJ2472531.1 lumazine synthase [Coemansia sp. RSA 2322]KAJ2477694.1 lumazine synthase [Coemansia sp. RSA 2320]